MLFIYPEHVVHMVEGCWDLIVAVIRDIHENAGTIRFKRIYHYTFRNIIVHVLLCMCIVHCSLVQRYFISLLIYHQDYTHSGPIVYYHYQHSLKESPIRQQRLLHRLYDSLSPSLPLFLSQPHIKVPTHYRSVMHWVHSISLELNYHGLL